jgi:acyl-CoA synthetase (AMP-forming)/AMP-acid ligase II
VIETFVLEEERAPVLPASAGDIVAVLAGNGPAAIAARDAATLQDLVLAPINPRLAPPEIAFVVEHSRATLLLVHADFHPAAHECLRRAGDRGSAAPA